MPASQVPASKIKAPVIEFDDDIFLLDTSSLPKGIWRDHSTIVYALPGRGKSTFLRSIVDHWGPEAVVGLDIEQRLYQVEVPRVIMPNLTQYHDSEHYARIFAWWDMILDRAERRATPFNPQSRVIAIDTLNTLYDLIYDADLVRHWSGKDIPREKWSYSFTWYKGLYDDFLKRIRRMIRLTNPNHGYSVIFNCHVALKHRKVDGDEIDQYEPQLPPMLQSIINKEIHVAFYLKASDGATPNYFVTGTNDSIPCKDQTGLYPRTIWPTWAAMEAAQLGGEWQKFPPKNLRLIKPKEEKK